MSKREHCERTSPQCSFSFVSDTRPPPTASPVNKQAGEEEGKNRSIRFYPQKTHIIPHYRQAHRATVCFGSAGGEPRNTSILSIPLRPSMGSFGLCGNGGLVESTGGPQKKHDRIRRCFARLFVGKTYHCKKGFYLI